MFEWLGWLGVPWKAVAPFCIVEGLTLAQATLIAGERPQTTCTPVTTWPRGQGFYEYVFPEAGRLVIAAYRGGKDEDPRIVRVYQYRR